MIKHNILNKNKNWHLFVVNDRVLKYRKQDIANLKREARKFMAIVGYVNMSVSEYERSCWQNNNNNKTLYERSQKEN